MDAPPITTSRMHPAIRVIVGAVVAAAAGWGTLIAWFVGIIEFTGCFISCGDPNPLGGVGLMAVAAGLLGATVAAVGFAIIGWQKRVMLKLWLIGTGIGAILGIASLAVS
jgi:hypothetical protein